ncbi:hypothetical protein NE235_03305 [Actinoallomurus spadix]|uniref:Uncharacterized protein n=1 Tax=Actinoallomurus spadix TaxID=79912 RepID=A0ABN0XLL6_9ACTN|nr:hypothetical protein [Actinoallomurus spadix]MCO5985132.1 hypothetical protein [Actinoallomurus spadix]
MATITEKLRDSKAFYVAAGAGDLAVEKLREMPKKIDKDLGGVALSYVTQVGGRAAEVMDELAERGKKIVGRVERQKSTQELEERAKATTRRARSTTGTARDTAASARETAKTAGKAATDTAKKVGD